MQNHRSRNLFLLVIAALIAMAASGAHAGNVPLWTFVVPPSSITSDTSVLSSITTDSIGNTFIVIQHYGSVSGTGVPSVGTQLFLLNGRGKLISGGDFPAINPTPVTLYVSAKKVVVKVVGLEQGTIDSTGKLVFTDLPYETADEQLLTAAVASGFDRKSVHTVVSASGYVSQIRRYSLTKLKP